MRRIVGGLALAAGMAIAAPEARAVDAAEAANRSDAERRLGEVLAELEAQRIEIEALKSRLSGTHREGGIEDAVKRYLESEEGQKALGRSKEDFRVFWKDGLNLQSADKAHSMKINARVMYDMIFTDADNDVEAVAGVFVRTNRFRRARLEFGGTLYNNIIYAMEVEFGATPHTFRDTYIGLKDVPGVGHVAAGLKKEPLSLEEMTSSKYITFMERSILNQAFIRAHRPGLHTWNSALEGRMGWAASITGDDDGRGTGTVGNNFGARVWGAPVYENKGETVVHVGLGFERRDPETWSDRIRSRPGISVGGRPVDTGAFSVAESDLWNLEAAAVLGPFSLQGEAMQYRSNAKTAGAPDADLAGWYLMGSWFITGESRPWKDGSFGRVKPKSNYGSGGAGAWEVAVRYANLDLQDGAITGGGMHTLDFGVNWYLNPNTRIMINYTMARVESLGHANTLAIRFQVDF